MEGTCISYVIQCFDKYPWQKQHEQRGAYLGSQFEGMVYRGQDGVGVGVPDSGLYCNHSLEAEGGDCDPHLIFSVIFCPGPQSTDYATSV